MIDCVLRRATAVFGLSVALLVSSTAVGQNASSDEHWGSLFDGKSLDGWTPKVTGHEFGENYADTFRVEDGLLKVSYDGYENFGGQFGHLFYKTPFSHYRLKIEYRFVGEQVAGGPGWAVRNSGVMLHCEPPQGMRKEQEFPVSIEAQFLGGDGSHERTTGNVCTPGTNIVIDGKLVTRHCNSSRSKTYHGDQWVTAELEVNGGGVVRHVIDGETVLKYEQPQLDESDPDGRRLLADGRDKLLREGYIALQAESHPVEFRKIEILALAEEADDESTSNGTDLLEGSLAKHWTTTGNWSLGDDGVVTLTPRPGEKGWQRYDAYLWSKKNYDDFEIEFDYRVEKGGNSGFYFNVGDKADPVAKGIEVQIYDAPADGDHKPTDHDSGGVIPGVPPTKTAAKPAGAWNHFRITVQGDALTVRLNGETVNKVNLDEHP
ncbi:MAG: DUF1080 domain-containing protein, partial [Planctomycetaceae bacterium]